MKKILGIVAVSIDCPDPSGLAQFYAELLGTDVTLQGEGYASMRLRNLWLNFLAVENYQRPTWPSSATAQQMHVDLTVEDLDDAQETARKAGAQVADFQPEPEQWRVMIDPVGHPFCLTLLTPEWTPDSDELEPTTVR